MITWQKGEMVGTGVKNKSSYRLSEIENSENN